MTDRRLMIFGIPLGLDLLINFMMLTMQFTKPFCFNCFTENLLIPINLLFLSFGYMIIAAVFYFVCFMPNPTDNKITGELAK